MDTTNLRHFDYGVEDDRFIVEWMFGTVYTITDKLEDKKFVVDNIDCDTSPIQLLQMWHERLKDEEDYN